MENKMEEVAKLLGLELEEEFWLKDQHTKYKLTSKGMQGWSEIDHKWWYSSLLQSLLTGSNTIIKRPKPVLDEKEKEYLSSVIKPFRDKVISIANYYEESIDNNFIEIEVKQNYCHENQYVSLPYFKKGTMYKGMKVGREYTLDQLGL